MVGDAADGRGRAIPLRGSPGPSELGMATEKGLALYPYVRTARTMTRSA